MGYKVDEETYDLIERNYDRWELDEQFDRQPLFIPKRSQRMDLIAAVYYYGKQTKDDTVAVTTNTLHACVVWSNYLKKPIIIECRRT